MPSTEPNPPAWSATEAGAPARAGGAPGATAWTRVLCLVLVLAALRVVYLLWLCPYDLGEDEAFYWEWSRHLDWSYYSKGPGIAWAFYASTSALGDTDLGVRIVAVIAAAVGALACAGLAIDLARDQGASPARAGVLAAVLFHLAPGLQAAGLLSTIDGPYIACWALAAWAGYRALRPHAGSGPSLRPWAALGACLALGILFKYTMLLLALGLVLAAFVVRRSPTRAPDAAGPAAAGRFRGVVLCASLAALGLVPIVVWNAHNDWGTVRHLLGAVGLPGGDRLAPASTAGQRAAAAWSYRPTWTLEMLAAQLGLVGPMLALMGLALLRHPARAFFLCASGGILMFYFLLTFVSSGEGNWPLAGFVTLIPLAAAWLAGSWTRPLARGLWNAALAFGLVAGLGMLRLDLIQSAVRSVSEPLARAIPLHRLDGARELAAGVQALAARVRSETGSEPLIITSHYGVASQLAFYLPGHPIVRCAMSRLGGRTIQQDFWPEHSLDLQALYGRPAILIGTTEKWARAFDRVEVVTDAQGARKVPGDPRRDRRGYVGYGYRGFAPAGEANAAVAKPGPPPHEGVRAADDVETEAGD